MCLVSKRPGRLQTIGLDTIHTCTYCSTSFLLLVQESMSLRAACKYIYIYMHRYYIYCGIIVQSTILHVGTLPSDLL